MCGVRAMTRERDPESIAAREAIDAIVVARVAGAVSNEAVSWVYSKAFEQFRKEASEVVAKQFEDELKRRDPRRWKKATR